MTEQTPDPQPPSPSWVPDATTPTTSTPPAQPEPPVPPVPAAAPPIEPNGPSRKDRPWLLPLVAAAALVIGLFGGFVAAHAVSSDGPRDPRVGIAGPGGVPGFGDGQGGQDWDHDGTQGFPPGFDPGNTDGGGQQFAPPGSSQQQNPTLPQPSAPSATPRSS